MQKKAFLGMFIAIALILTIAWQISLYWGSLAMKDMRAEVFLTQFDKITSPGKENCFSVEVRSSYERKTVGPFIVIANGKVVGRKDIDFSEPQNIKECIPTEILSQGENLIEIYAGVHRLFYHAILANERSQEKTPAVSISFAGNENVLVKVENNDMLEYAPLEIYVNGALDHRAYFSGEKFESVEKVSLKEGMNEIGAEFKGITAATTAEKTSSVKMSPIIGIALISALLCVLAFLVFANFSLPERIAYSGLSFLSILILEVFLLELLGVLSPASISILTAATMVAIAAILKHRFEEKDSIEEIRQRHKMEQSSVLFWLLVGIFIFSSFFFNFFTASYYSGWTAFYERQSRMLTEEYSIPSTDEFSFLGTKPFGYISGYFFANSGISLLTALPTQQSYAITMLIAQAAFLTAAFLFFRSFGFDRKRSYLALIALLLGGFVFSDFSFNIRHVISYGLLFLALFFLRKEKALHSGISLAIGTFVQTPVFMMFIAALPIVLTKKETIRTALKSIIISAVLSILLFAPTLLRYGIPNQAEYNVWGYMWSIPLYGFFLDYLPLVVLIGLFIVPFLLIKDVRFDKFSLRVTAFLALFIFIQLFISYRINVVATIAFALFVGLLFPKRFFENRLAEYSLSVLFAVAFALMFLIIISFYPVVPAAQNAYSFVKENTSTEAKFLNEPTLGHAFILLAERKSSADLAVEYANDEMILDSFEFIKTGKREILEKYGIDYVINRSIFLDEKPVGDNLWYKTIEFEQLDKIYSNGLFFVHWVDKSLFFEKEKPREKK